MFSQNNFFEDRFESLFIFSILYVPCMICGKIRQRLPYKITVFSHFTKFVFYDIICKISNQFHKQSGGFNGFLNEAFPFKIIFRYSKQVHPETNTQSIF
jgi:hypothetical protein